MTWRVIVGTLSFVLTMILFGYVAVTEQDRMAQFDTAYQARQIETGGQIFENNCARCHGLNGEGSGLAPALNSPDLLWSAPGTQPERLKAAGWAGTIEDYVHATVAGGRPQASVTFSGYIERMPTWSQEFGGPLRGDQVDAVVAYVMNWAPAYANFTPEPVATVVPVGNDINIELPEGDAAAGEAAVAVAPAGCTACHISTGGAPTLGPNWIADESGEGIGTRAELRIEQDDYAGAATSGDQYLFESIIAPDAYIVPGATHVANGQSIMPHTYGSTLDAQTVANIIAYLQTLE